MASTVISLERSLEINSPDYLYTCTKCRVSKPNTEYVYSPNKRVPDSLGRQYTTSCKLCRNLYNKSIRENPTEAYLKGIIDQRKKHKLSSVFLSSKGNAKRRGLEHSITRKYIEEIYASQNGLCYYTGGTMFTDMRGLSSNNDGVSIDRIDSSKGYIEGNIVLCRWIVNRMKNDLTHEEFLELVSKINNKFNLS